MSLKIIETCDKCGSEHDATSGDHLPVIEVTINKKTVFGNENTIATVGYFEQPQKQMWCADCLHAIGLVQPWKNHGKPAACPPPTMEEILRELIREIVQEEVQQ